MAARKRWRRRREEADTGWGSTDLGGEKVDTGRGSADLGGDARKAGWRWKNKKASYGGADLFYLDIP
jgi:hypothetical protein